jgi:hypothetical protein
MDELRVFMRSFGIDLDRLLRNPPPPFVPPEPVNPLKYKPREDKQKKETKRAKDDSQLLGEDGTPSASSSYRFMSSYKVRC